MNQKYAYLKKTFKKEKLDVYHGFRRHNSTSCSVVCILCGYNSKRVATNFCPICKETLISYHTSIKIPKFKSKMWDKFVNHVLAKALIWKINNTESSLLRKNWPTKNRMLPPHILFDDVFDLKYYDLPFCVSNGMFPNIDLLPESRISFIKHYLKTGTLY